MEILIDAGLESLANHGVIIDSGLIMVLVAGLALLYKYVIKPLKTAVEDLLTRKQLEDVRDEMQVSDQKNFQELVTRLNTLVAVAEDISDTETGVDRDVKDIKKDVENIKDMLNQIQGHLMYNRSDGFGNRELR